MALNAVTDWSPCCDSVTISNRNHLTPYLEEVLKQMQPLLTINSPDNGINHSLSDSDQLFIYETASTLVVSSALEPEVCEIPTILAGWLF